MGLMKTLATMRHERAIRYDWPAAKGIVLPDQAPTVRWLEREVMIPHLFPSKPPDVDRSLSERDSHAGSEKNR